MFNKESINLYWELIDTMVRELCLLLCEHHVVTILTVYFCFSFGQESYRLFITSEVLNTVSAETAVSSGVFHAFQCVVMQTAFLAQGVN